MFDATTVKTTDYHYTPLSFVPLQAEHAMALADVCPEMEITPESAVDLEDAGSWSVLEGPRLLAIGGIAYRRPGVGLAWSVLTRGWRRHARAITERVIWQMDRTPLRRIEATVRCGHEAGHRWMARLGFECEAPRMRAYAMGEDWALYARVK